MDVSLDVEELAVPNVTLIQEDGSHSLNFGVRIDGGNHLATDTWSRWVVMNSQEREDGETHVCSESKRKLIIGHAETMHRRDSLEERCTSG